MADEQAPVVVTLSPQQCALVSEWADREVRVADKVLKLKFIPEAVERAANAHAIRHLLKAGVAQ